LAEIAELKEMAGQRDDAAEAQVAYWDAGSPSYRWIEIALDQFKSKPISGPRISRGMTLINVAIYDALVAAWAAKYTYNRPRPSSVDPTLATLVAIPNSPAYPSEHAVAAGAAATILSYLYPDDAQTFEAQAEEAARSRLLAGVQYSSDVEAGLELGRQVAQQVIARAMSDGSDAVWDGQMPSGPGYWSGEKPVEPLGGTWQTWVLPSGDAVRPAPPLAYDSAELAAELSEIKAVTHTWQLDQKALYWQTLDGLFTFWYDNASRHIFEHHLDSNPPQAARIYAAMSVSQYDAYVACLDAKYTYWAMRPFHLDSEVMTLFPTPAHPSYPSGHSCVLGAVAATLGELFPEQAELINAVVEEMGESRIYAGIHFRSDVEAGLILGRAVSDLVAKRVEEMVQP
jgi:membrane-associated phospholipid phosphatase